MQTDFTNSDVKNLLQVELCLSDDTDAYGMTGTGLFIVNPPWQLKSQLSDILPYLQEKLGSDSSSYNVKQLIAE
jgi:23S rRNA (adenine2030-N6)-methyltransferase